jgi:hypothetical protein
MVLVSGKGETVLPRTVQAILQDALPLQLRERREKGQISERGVAVARGRLEARLDRICNVATARPAIGAWLIISFASATPCLLS